MAYATENRTDALSVASRLDVFRAAIMDRVTKYQLYRTTMLELKTLSDRELNDLGIDRGMIRDIAHEAAYGR
ncbi:MAG: DUF1127 domain-containing protein [Rubellimicrobium sp.]|nr:DUF1127 domain-containing protein [Rubellimicrobium sp.]